MKHIKHLFFLSLVCSIVLFIACDEETGLGGDYDEENEKQEHEVCHRTRSCIHTNFIPSR